MDIERPYTPRAGIAAGIALVVLGVGAYVISDFASLTALIPAGFGILLVLFGRTALTGIYPRESNIAIGVLALVSILGSARGVSDLIDLLSGESVDSTTATVSMGLMILIGLAVLVVVVIDYRADDL